MKIIEIESKPGLDFDLSWNLIYYLTPLILHSYTQETKITAWHPSFETLW